MSDDEYAAVEQDVIDSMERSAEVYGLSRSAGRVYGTLFFASDPLSIPELVEETGYAKSTISNVTRKLSRIGLIHRQSSSGGGRRVHFEPETDFWFVIRDVFRQYLYREMTATERTLDRALDRLDEGGETVSEKRERVRRLQENYEDLEALLELAMDYSAEELLDAIEAYEAGEE